MTDQGWGFENPAARVCCDMCYRTGPNGERITRMARFSNRDLGFGSAESHAPDTFAVTFERAANVEVPTSAPRALFTIHLPLLRR